RRRERSRRRTQGGRTVGTDAPQDTERLLCLVTGASGYIGGRLVPELLAAGHRVRCLARSPDKLRDHPWAADAATVRGDGAVGALARSPRGRGGHPGAAEAETVRGDVPDAASGAPALRDVDVAYYLVHALGSGSRFEHTDRRAARIFAEQAPAAGVRRIVYL